MFMDLDDLEKAQKLDLLVFVVKLLSEQEQAENTDARVI